MKTIVLPLLALLLPARAWGQHCASPRALSARFAVVSSRNQTGHWTVKVELGHAGQLEQQQGPLRIDVEHSVEQCAGADDLTVALTTTVTGPPPSAGPGYMFVPGLGSYKLHTVVKTWEDARRTCQQEGAHLAVLNSEFEASVVKSMYARHPSLDGVLYLGFTDRQSEGDFVTIFGESLNNTGYAQWHPGQPDNSNKGEHCGTIFRNGKLNDQSCEQKHAFVCEQEFWQ